MPSCVSAAQAQPPVNSQTSLQSPKPQTPAPQPQKPDSVHISAAAQKALSGDVDNDGDSH
jgi:hypothetical protein